MNMDPDLHVRSFWDYTTSLLGRLVYVYMSVTDE